MSRQALQALSTSALRPQLADDFARDYTDPNQFPLFHDLRIAPFSHHQDARSDMEKSYPTKGRSFGELPIDKMTPHDVAKRMASALTKDYGDFKSTEKRIANDTGASVKTASNWLGGENTMHLLYFLRSMARSRAVRAEVEALTGLSFADPDGDRETSRVIQRVLGNP